MKIYILPSLILGYIIIMVSYSDIYSSLYDSKRLVQGAIFMISGLLLLVSKEIRSEWYRIIKLLGKKDSRLLGIGVLLLCLGMVSVLFAENRPWAVLEFTHYLLLLNLLILCTAAYLSSPALFNHYVPIAIGVMAGIYLINCTISYSYSFFIEGYPLWPKTNFPNITFRDIGALYPEPFLNFDNYRFFNQVQTWTLPFLALLVVTIPKRNEAFAWLAFIVLCGWWTLVFASDARGTLVSAFISFVFIFILYKRRAYEWLKIYGVSAFIGVIAFLVLFKLFQTEGATPFTRYTSSGRLDQWMYSLKLIMENPLFGVGPMNFAVFNEYVIYGGPHNGYLQLASEFGMLFFISLIFFISIITIQWFKWVKETEETDRVNHIHITITAAVVAGAVHIFFSNLINTPMSQMIMVLIGAWVLGILLKESGEEQVNVPTMKFHAAMAVTSVLLCGMVLAFYIKQVPELESNRFKYLEATELQYRYSPRYWLQGIIEFSPQENDRGIHEPLNKR